MAASLNIIHLEDDPREVELTREMLKAAGISCAITPVQTEPEFTRALESGQYDLVIADYSLPGFDGMSALKLTRSRRPDLPFILMSGTVGEEFAIESLKNGATDYVLKERRARIVPAVRRAVRESDERQQRRQLEEQFIKAQKMEVVGQLSSGIAHDFNNLLGIIIGNNDYMMVKLGQEDPLLKNADEIRHAAERAAAVTRQLLVFSRNQTVLPVVLELNEVIQGMDKMLTRLLDERIELSLSLEKKLGRINADSGYVGQMLMNLVINARDAMPNGGSLFIETANIKLDKKSDLAHAEVKPGHYVMLSVRDTGTGMSQAVKARLFEAFFTTKPKGKGTGLGLATCQTIARQSKAHIDVESELGRGTTFKVYFPRVDQPVSTTTRFLKVAEAVGGTETLLIVEDESALRRMTSMALENQGYKVLQAATGQEGLRVANAHKETPVALVITDIVMPQMDGRIMAEWLRASFPDIKILFTSGYVDPAILRQGLLDPEVGFLPKPYTLAALTTKIREVLDTPSSRS